MNRKAGAISIGLLVIAVLIVSTMALVSFNNKRNFKKETIGMTLFLEDIYSKKEAVNYYLGNIIEDMGAPKDKSDFIAKMKIGLENYKSNGKFLVPELEQVESQLKEENAAFENGKYSIELDISVSDVSNTFNISHSYKKKFVK